MQAAAAKTSPFFYMTELSLEELELCKCYLRVHLRVIRRSHDGWCSDAGEEREEHETVVKHFSVPMAFQEAGKLRANLYDANGTVAETGETSPLFYEWTTESCCGGSGYCGFEDTHIPFQIEYVMV